MYHLLSVGTVAAAVIVVDDDRDAGADDDDDDDGLLVVSAVRPGLTTPLVIMDRTMLAFSRIHLFCFT